MDKAIVKVVNAYNRFALPRYWGSGKSASADGTKWNVFEQNLLSEYHIRYGGYGGIGYYHVSDKYIALFSHFIPCGVYEAVYILDGLIYNQSDIQPDTLHGDTQAQSTPVFALAHLLGINLMPRIRNIKDLVFFRGDRGDHFEHIGSLFRGNIDWSLIARHLKDMLRVVISIKAGKIAPSTILRRLGTASRKNRLYYAFRELGRVVAAFTLREVAIHLCYRVALSIAKGAVDKTPLRVFGITGKALVQAQWCLAREQGDAVMAFLAVVMHVVAELANLCLGELFVGDFGFLQADHIRLMFVDQRCQLMRAGTQAIDIEGDDLHRRQS